MFKSQPNPTLFTQATDKIYITNSSQGKAVKKGATALFATCHNSFVATVSSVVSLHSVTTLLATRLAMKNIIKMDPWHDKLLSWSPIVQGSGEKFCLRWRQVERKEGTKQFTVHIAGRSATFLH